MKHKQHSRLTQMAALLFFVVLVAVGAAVLTNRSLTEAAPKPKQPIGAAVPSQFKFSGATNWWQGATNQTSMAVFHDAHDCFISVQHKTGTIAADAAKRQQSNADLVMRGYTVMPGATVATTIRVGNIPQQYELVQSKVASPAGVSQLEGGQEFGYVPLSKGYVFVEGYCDTPDQLAATIPALQAVTFDQSK